MVASVESLTGPSTGIIDYDSQLSEAIRWALVEAGIRSEILPPETVELDAQELQQRFRALIHSGGGGSVNDPNAPRISPEMLEIPTLGICFGAQLIAKSAGGEVAKVEVDGHHRGEYGQKTLEVDPDALIYSGLTKVKVLLNKGETITRVPEGYKITGLSDGMIASFERLDGKVAATQFHPEVAETDEGTEMMVRFLRSAAGIEPDPNYTLERVLNEYMDLQEARAAEILETGDFIAGFLSGGVDSMTAAEMVYTVAKRLNRLDQIKFFCVDNGHMRVEDDEIIELMQARGMPVEVIDARDEFFHGQVAVKPKNREAFLAGPLVEEADPEIKRLIMGGMFKNIADRIMAKIRGLTGKKVYLLQGTNSSDVRESESIKSHHNVSSMDDMRQADELFEPLIGLMKYHIRMLAEDRYNLPEWFATRQPFPGPGISPSIVVNLKGELVQPEQILQDRLDKMIASRAGTKLKGHIVGLNTVGQKGDGRSLANVVFFEGEADWQLLAELSQEIIEHFATINRAFYVPEITINRSLISGATTRDNEQFTAEIRHMREVHRQAMLTTGLDPYLTQHFVGTLGVDLVGNGKPTMPIRLFVSGLDPDKERIRRTGRSRETLRTGLAGWPGKNMNADAFVKYLSIMKEALIYHGWLAYDITDKPPGTVEWE